MYLENQPIMMAEIRVPSLTPSTLLRKTRDIRRASATIEESKIILQVPNSFLLNRWIHTATPSPGSMPKSDMTTVNRHEEWQKGVVVNNPE